MHAAQTQAGGELSNIRVRRGNGEVIELGKPKTWAFRWNLLKYKFRLLKEKIRE